MCKKSAAYFFDRKTLVLFAALIYGYLKMQSAQYLPVSVEIGRSGKYTEIRPTNSDFFVNVFQWEFSYAAFLRFAVNTPLKVSNKAAIADDKAPYFKLDQLLWHSSCSRKPDPKHAANSILYLTNEAVVIGWLKIAWNCVPIRQYWYLEYERTRRFVLNTNVQGNLCWIRTYAEICVE